MVEFPNIRDVEQPSPPAKQNVAQSPNGSQPDNDDWLKPKPVSQLTTVQPDQILRGILYQGCKMVLMAGSKSFKTWTLMDIAYCVGNGLLWWGTHTKQCQVVYLDWELLDFDFRWRMEQIQNAYATGDLDVVQRIGLRGKTFNDKDWGKIYEHMRQAQAGLVVADPTYKLLGPFRDENAAKDIAQITLMFDRLVEETSASLIYAQHFSKGNQAAKESIDRGAGSGVWARDSDAIITLTKHQEGDDYLTVEHTLRSFPRVDPFVVQWNCPLFQRRPDLDPAALKQPPPKTQSHSPKYSIDDLIGCLHGHDLATAEFQRLVEQETGMSRAKFYELLKIGQDQGRLHKSQLDNKWEAVESAVQSSRQSKSSQ